MPASAFPAPLAPSSFLSAVYVGSVRPGIPVWHFSATLFPCVLSALPALPAPALFSTSAPSLQKLPILNTAAVLGLASQLIGYHVQPQASFPLCLGQLSLTHLHFVRIFAPFVSPPPPILPSPSFPLTLLPYPPFLTSAVLAFPAYSRSIVCISVAPILTVQPAAVCING